MGVRTLSYFLVRLAIVAVGFAVFIAIYSRLVEGLTAFFIGIFVGIILGALYLGVGWPRQQS